jgi:hypothetical protein
MRGFDLEWGRSTTLTISVPYRDQNQGSHERMKAGWVFGETDEGDQASAEV